MKETEKAYNFRHSRLDFNNYLTGHGVDIGCGDAPLSVLHGTVDACDMLFGHNAETMEHVEDNKYDFAYSSHCLEHLHNPGAGLKNWSRIVKPNGHVYFTIPDFTIYEHHKWPSQFNGDHKSTFSLRLTREAVGRPNHYGISDLMAILYDAGLKLVSLHFEDQMYDYSDKDPNNDQTLGVALCQICVVAKKIQFVPAWGV